MESKYIHLIALIVAVFFAGIYLRGEGARKKEIKRELKVIEKRHEEINRLVDEINVVAARKDSLLNLKIASARHRIQQLEFGEKLVRETIDRINMQIDDANGEIRRLAQQINDVPRFIVEVPNVHSAFVDPDASVVMGMDFEEIPVSLGQALLDTTINRVAPPTPTFLQLAKAYAAQGITEQPPGSNRSPDIDIWSKTFLAEPFNAEGKGPPYCAIFVSYCLKEAGNVVVPRKYSARARDYIRGDSFIADMLVPDVAARIVQRGGVEVPAGTMVIWKLNKDPQDWRGHVGFVLDWEGQKGRTVEANTSPPKDLNMSGDNQRDGHGVYEKERTLNPFNFFRITHFSTVVQRGEIGETVVLQSASN